MQHFEIINPMPHEKTRELIEKLVEQNGIILQQNANLINLLANPVMCTNEIKLDIKE